eukprot:1565790-Pyramimonas_sp.AAC.1
MRVQFLMWRSSTGPLLPLRGRGVSTVRCPPGAAGDSQGHGEWDEPRGHWCDVRFHAGRLRHQGVRARR